MSKYNIGIRPQEPPEISEKIAATTLNSIREILPHCMIKQACDQIGYDYSNRILNPLVTVLHMILAAIWPEESFNASWQVLWTAVASRFPELKGKSPSRASVSKARSRLPLSLWDKLFACISQKAQDMAEDFAYWRGHRTALLDGTCVSMPDKPELFKAFGMNTGYHGKGRYPLARIVTVCLANTMTVISYALGRYDQSETTLAFSILSTLKKGDLLVADRYFAAAHFYCYYKSLALEFLTRAHQRLKISRIKRLDSYSQNDFLGWLKINKNYRKKDACLPEKILVRFIRASVRIRGKVSGVDMCVPINYEKPLWHTHNMVAGGCWCQGLKGYCAEQAGRL